MANEIIVWKDTGIKLQKSGTLYSMARANFILAIEQRLASCGATA